MQSSTLEPYVFASDTLHLQVVLLESEMRADWAMLRTWGWPVNPETHPEVLLIG